MEDFGKKGKSLHEINQEQAKAALKAQYDAAAASVFMAEMRGVDDLEQDDYDAFQDHKNRLLSFAPALMDDRFSEEVRTMLKKLNDLLDEPIKGLY